MTRWVLVSLFAVAQVGWAQQAISARSGLIHFIEGEGTISGQDVKLKEGQFPEVRPGQRLATEVGRVEVLLNPGIFLRLDNDSSFRMISDKLTDSHIELEKGRAMVEVVELIVGNHVTIHVGNTAIEPLKEGVYEIDAEAGTAKVFDGQLQVSQQASALKLGRGRAANFTPILLASKFNRKDTGELYAWSSMRSGKVAEANYNIASSLGQVKSRPSRSPGMWAWYPGMGMFTYIPRNGRLRNPFGWYYYNPYFLWAVYNQPYFGPPSNTGYQAENGAWAGRPASVSPSAPAAVAAQTGDISRSAPSAPPAAPAGGGPRDRGAE